MNKHFKQIAGEANFGGADKITNKIIYDSRLENFSKLLINDVINTLMSLHGGSDGSHNYYYHAANVIKEKYDL